MISRLFIPLLFFSLVACGQSESVQNIGVEEAVDLIENPDVQIVDVRTPDEFNSGYIKGAQLITLNTAEFDKKVSELDKNKPVMVYCLSGGRSANAASKIASAGFSTVYNMSEGMMNWKRTGQAVEMPGSGSEQSNTKQSGSLTKEQFVELTKSSEIVLVDFFAPWCAPCKKMEPSLKALESKYKDRGFKLVKVDIDQNENLVNEYGLESIPRFFLYKNGELIKDLKGYQTDEQLETAAQSAL